jgi:hypothetical protein
MTEQNILFGVPFAEQNKTPCRGLFGCSVRLSTSFTAPSYPSEVDTLKGRGRIIGSAVESDITRIRAGHNVRYRKCLSEALGATERGAMLRVAPDCGLTRLSTKASAVSVDPRPSGVSVRKSA